MIGSALAPPSPHRDGVIDPSMQDSGLSPREKRSIRSRLSDQIQKVRGRSPSPQPRSTDAWDNQPASPSKRLSVQGLIERSTRLVRSPSPRPSSRNSVVYDSNATEYYASDLPNWQLYDGHSMYPGHSRNDGPFPAQARPGAQSRLDPLASALVNEPKPKFVQPVAKQGTTEAQGPVAEAEIIDQYAEQQDPAGNANHLSSFAPKGITAGAFGRPAEPIPIEPTATESRWDTTSEDLHDTQTIEQSLTTLTSEDNTVIDYGDQPSDLAMDDDRVELEVLSAYDDQEMEQDDTQTESKYRKRRAEPVAHSSMDLDEKPLPPPVTEPITSANEAVGKQEKLFNAMQSKPESSGLSELLNRVVQPPRESWLQGIWPTDPHRNVSDSEYSQRTMSDNSLQSQGVIFQGADASPSLYSTSSLDRSNTFGSRQVSISSRRTNSTSKPLQRAATLESRPVSHASDDELEAFERKRRSMLEARRILEQEKRHGSSDFRRISNEAPPPVPSKDTPRPRPPSKDVGEPAEWQAERQEAEWYAQQEAEWHAQQEAEWYAQQEAEWHAQQEAEWHAQQEAEWHAKQEAEWHAQQEAEWHAQQEAEWHAQQEAEWHAQQGHYRPNSMMENAPNAMPENAAGNVVDEQPKPAVVPKTHGASTFLGGLRALGKRKAPPAASQRPLVMPGALATQPSAQPAAHAMGAENLGRTQSVMTPASRAMQVPMRDKPPATRPISALGLGHDANEASKVIPICEPPTPASLAETIIDERGRRMKPDGFGGLIPVDNDDDDIQSVKTTAAEETPKAPHVQSMEHDFTRKSERPTAGIPSPVQHFQHNLHQSTSPIKQLARMPTVSSVAPRQSPRANLREETHTTQRPHTVASNEQKEPWKPPKAPTAGAMEPFQVASEVYTTPANLQGSVGRMTWTPEMAEAAAKYIQTMTASASMLGVTPENLPKPDSQDTLSVRPATELTVPAGMAPSRSVVEQLQARGVDLVLEPGKGAELDTMPLQQALREAMVRFYLYEKHSVPILKELDKRLVALEHWSLLDSSLESGTPSWNQEAVAKITSEVRREMRTLMAGIKEIHESRLRLQSATQEPNFTQHKRKRPASIVQPEKRYASETNSVRKSSEQSTQSTATQASVAKQSPSTPTRSTHFDEQSTPKQASLPPPSPLASLAGLGPRPYSPIPMQQAAMQSATLEAAVLEASAAQAAAEHRIQVASMLEHMAEERYNQSMQLEDVSRPNLSADDTADATNLTLTPARVKQALESQHDQYQEVSGDQHPAPQEDVRSQSPESENKPLRVPVAVKPRYSDGVAESGLLQALMRVDERAHTPPPPSPSNFSLNKSGEELHQPHDGNSSAKPSESDSNPERKSTEALQATEPKELVASHTDSPRKPMASVGNVQASASGLNAIPSKISTHPSSSALRSRAQRYLRNSASSTEIKSSVTPSLKSDTSVPDENTSPSKPKYQPSALSESLRRRMAAFEP
ncbi:hypothetical protein MPSI1_003719 [Malassezia psittaci]|uniref:Uncharacterized protein n=1 Tax=Malassezia psittaci TaxID=1821823 RepID=A0AAF0JFF9_9BASI|nr:hypothetical protein MPSI1_003719 [Malassezia psittaci]